MLVLQTFMTSHFAWYLLHAGSKIRVGFHLGILALEGFFRMSFKVSLGFLLGFIKDFLGVSFKVSLGFHLGFIYIGCHLSLGFQLGFRLL